MFEVIDSAAENLHNAQAGWVTRRDAADLLGKVAARALAALQKSSEEMDVDVRRAVDGALGQAAAALEGVKPVPADRSYSLEELVSSCEKSGERTVEKTDGGAYDIVVALKNGRKQTVHVRKFKRSDGIDLVQVYTVCGKADAKAYEWALRANMKLVLGAVALASNDHEERFVLTTTFLANQVSRREMKAAVKEMAYYGDWIEGKLTGQDEF